jgi:hypothetical protein
MKTIGMVGGTGKNMKAFTLIFFIIATRVASVYCQPGPAAIPFDVFKVMEIVRSNDNNALWPNFRPTQIPVLVFDSINTWLFHSEAKPDGFSEVQEHPGVFRFAGQYPLVQGNSTIRIGDQWLATSVFSSYAQRTGEKYSTRDLAGIIIHEQFHVFSRIEHPTWQQNDGYLLLYPSETPEALFLRRSEKEAFRNAVVSSNPCEIAGWVQEGFDYRNKRFSLIAPAYADYEKQLQRTEGLSDYIERLARGSDPLAASTITNGIAPAGVRDLGYVEGRWIAMILDKLNPGWKSVLEENDTLYLEDILKKTISDLPVESQHFTTQETESLNTEAKGDFKQWQSKKKQEIEQFNAMPGNRIEINASNNPLAIRIFEPLEIEILDDGSIFHRLIFSAGNEAGSLRIMHQPSITWFDNSLRIVRLVVNGLTESPQIIENENKIVIRSNNNSIELKYTKLIVNGSLYILEL